MALNVLRRQGCHALNVCRPRVTLIATNVALSIRQKSTAVRFSVALPSEDPDGHSTLLFQVLRNWHRLEANVRGHNAAVVLATPDQARNLTDDGFMSEMVEALAGPGYRGKFRLVAAAVDHIAPMAYNYQPLQGFSILRGQDGVIIPSEEEGEPTKQLQDKSQVSAMVFDVGSSRVTVPCANTAFQNNRDSTLISSLYVLEEEGPKLVEREEVASQRVKVPLPSPLKYESKATLWVPMLPLTRARPVTASFGNIVKGIEVDGDSIPASQELEEAVDRVFKHIPHLAESGPIGIWALVIPKEMHKAAKKVPRTDDSSDDSEVVEEIVRRIEHLCKHGARLYQILSGGGGWGAKKGLLSLDPQRSHFPPSEEESLEQFTRSLSGSDFAPLGSYIQFYTPLRPRKDKAQVTPNLRSVSFGVCDERVPVRRPGNLAFHENVFGALSDNAVFVSSLEATSSRAKRTPKGAPSKLSAPNSRVYYASAYPPKLLKNNFLSTKHQRDPILSYYRKEGLGAEEDAPFKDLEAMRR